MPPISRPARNRLASGAVGNRDLVQCVEERLRVEAVQLGSVERLERALALFLVVAWRIAYLMRMGRTCPDLDAELFFDADEIRSAYWLTEVEQPAKPKLNHALRLIAQLGGFLGRKGDGEPRCESYLARTQRRSCRCQNLTNVTRRR